MLEVEDLVAGYGTAEILHGVSFSVEERSITVLLGSNGAGKTTLMRSLAGVLRPHRGRMRFAGVPIQAVPTHERVRLGIALVPEGRMVFPDLTVEETLKVGAHGRWARQHRAEETERLYELFPRLAERRRQAAGSLSGGEQQMLAIARALMARPRLLLLDEPTLGLAPQMARFVFKLVAQLREGGLTVLLAEQEVQASLTLADRGFVLENGYIALEGAAPTLAMDPRIRAAYLGL
ncbi:MAG TPA: ABC transporter ATP-binding protein [Alphaproteobacteria bacterium]|nr:ABC transporter ATP-binding protein [Alphaproteobacteria bacterium]